MFGLNCSRTAVRCATQGLVKPFCSAAAPHHRRAPPPPRPRHLRPSGGILFLFVGGVLLLRGGKDEADEERRLKLLAHARGLAILGLGISVDELTVGLSAGLLGLPVALTVIWIAFQAFAAAQLGLRFGARVGGEVRERSKQAAGVALILVAVAPLVLKLLKL
jgi:putative Mn2+ efflux pump MntP